MTARPEMRCAGCGAGPAPGDPYGWTCPNRLSGGSVALVAGDVDHVMVRHLDVAGLSLVSSDSENPFVRYRQLLLAYHRWREAGASDATFVDLVEELDDAVGAVAARAEGFRRTPLIRHELLDAAVGTRVWVKDETGNVGGSHKGRHLFGLMIMLRVLERLGLVSAEQAVAPLAIASCGNAALAAAIVAAAAGRPLEVFIPPDADPAVVAQLEEHGARLHVCRRQAKGSGADAGAGAGNPCYAAFVAAVSAGAIPFGCQGPDNGLTIEGGATLAWEVAETLHAAGVAAPQRLVVQVGGGALASACALGMGEATTLGVLQRAPALDTVQTAGCAPLERAHAAVLAEIRAGRTAETALAEARRHRSRFMWPWEAEPRSVAGGILDDETYDFLAVLNAMVSTGGTGLVVDEQLLMEANDLAVSSTGIDVDHTGSAGLAGLLLLARTGRVPADADVIVVFSGARR